MLIEVGLLRLIHQYGRALSLISPMEPCSGTPNQDTIKSRMANEEGLIANGTSIHAGLRTRLLGKTFSDYDHDETVGFVYIEADGMYGHS
jgi:hypothetical protein